MSGRETVSFNLIEACWARKWDDAKYILGGTDYDVNYKNEEAFTALHWTANHGEITLTYTLLLAGADPAATNRFGSTPMSLAARADHLAVVQLLASFGAPLPVTKADPGPTPEDAAEYTEYVMKAIQEAKSKTFEERAAVHKNVIQFQQCESDAKLILSGEFRRERDANAQRKRDEAKAEAAAREAKRAAEARQHKERLAKIRQKELANEAKAREKQKAAERAGRKALLKQWSLPLLLLGMLWALFSQAFPRYSTPALIGVFGIGAVHSVHLWIEAPILMAKAQHSKLR